MSAERESYGPATPLPINAEARKALPVFSGVLSYFPLAIAAVANISRRGGEQHAPGQPLKWHRDLSKDQLDALSRHVLDVAIKDAAGEDATDELAQVVWRGLAELQLRLEAKGGIK